ncbi:NADPH-dependent 7-cyano-7-deazaguanine reductase [Desulfamplus magnetovallimortis]|uniref:NADPH-dependent 7-cyano-7-deazaguanine reductase n=1 Tax=Desulfamplus magnetovallimortis TaxID=1246637 RepID=A0A1W1H825_9BACT|nr:NADPH-dependent 7-cyano-7-deazaguanine reductase [Desulfamplus magnetovallimortis]SLM28528.1 NADPH-dependent 7-cyano-7-deazaguanine reductase [Desulfamplus magnetovallimortis]
MKQEITKKNIPLGDKVTHSRTYNPDHLFPVRRSLAREEIGIHEDTKLPFGGWDIWNAYEISWLDMKGKPVVAIGEITFPCTTKNIVESKSLKLYLNSFNQSRFESPEQVLTIMEKDLSACVTGRSEGEEDYPGEGRSEGEEDYLGNGTMYINGVRRKEKGTMDLNNAVSVTLRLPSLFHDMKIEAPCGESIDDLDVEITHYKVEPSFLRVMEGGRVVEQTIHSNLLRTNCPVTEQPDWGSVIIDYKGKEIDRKGLLAYIVSFREHTGFHENCVERMFMDIMEMCCPEKLSVYARFTRRGGIDINPFRSNCGNDSLRYENGRLARQ